MHSFRQNGNQATHAGNRYLTTEEVADFLRMSRRSVDRLRERGVLKAVRLSKGLIRYNAQDVYDALEAAKD